MFDGFEPFEVQAEPGITIYGIKGGTGPPLLLLHGFPQTHAIWHIIAPQLTSSYTTIAIDLRGYGKSSKPPSCSSHSTYAKSEMAKDCIAVMNHFNFPKFRVLAHDRGARVAHKLAIDHPEHVEKMMLLDIAPTLAMYEQTSQEFATAYWHWFFLIQPAPLPEKLLLANPETFFPRWFPEFMAEEAVSEYKALFGDEGGVTGMCEDYRAGATVDLRESKRDIREGWKIRCPLRVLWGEKGIVGKLFDPLKEWRAVSEGKVSGEGVPSGHYIAEEIPDILLEQIREFF